MCEGPSSAVSNAVDLTEGHNIDSQEVWFRAEPQEKSIIASSFAYKTSVISLHSILQFCFTMTNMYLHNGMSNIF